MTYRIKPLEWQKLGNEYEHAEAGFTSYLVYLYEPISEASEWHWKQHGYAANRCESLEAGKAACEADWQRRIAACLEPVGWLPIDTAPKDGTPILGKGDSGHRYVCVWAWSPNAQRHGWCGEAFGTLLPFNPQPKHWMPLPAQPKGVDRG